MKTRVDCLKRLSAALTVLIASLVLAEDSVVSGTVDVFGGWVRFTTNSPLSICLINTQNPPEIRSQLKSDGLKKTMTLKRRIEELSGLPCLLVHYTQITRLDLDRPNIKAIVLTAWKKRDDQYHDQELNEMVKVTRTPLIAFCGGHHLVYLAYGGKSGIMRKLKPGEKDPNPKYYPGLYKEWDLGKVRIVKRDPIFEGLPDVMTVPQRHYAECKELPSDFDLLASSDECRVEAIKHKTRLVYATQFHPEMYDDDHADGKTLLKNFFRIATASARDK